MVTIFLKVVTVTAASAPNIFTWDNTALTPRYPVSEKIIAYPYVSTGCWNMRNDDIERIINIIAHSHIGAVYMILDVLV